MRLVLEASSIKHAFIWRFFPEQLCSIFSRKQNVYFHRIDKFKTLYLEKLQALFWIKTNICS